MDRNITKRQSVFRQGVDIQNLLKSILDESVSLDDDRPCPKANTGRWYMMWGLFKFPGPFFTDSPKGTGETQEGTEQDEGQKKAGPVHSWQIQENFQAPGFGQEPSQNTFE
jgi:hypothetical protein